jgi:hypothetical protein
LTCTWTTAAGPAWPAARASTARAAGSAPTAAACAVSRSHDAAAATTGPAAGAAGIGRGRIGLLVGLGLLLALVIGRGGRDQH